MFHFAAAVEIKLVPLMVSVKAAPPAMAMAGLKLEIVGGCGMMVKVTLGEMPPSVLTVMLPAPGLAVRAAGSVAVSWVELMRVVASAVEPQEAMEAASKFVPLMVSRRSAPPATVEAGLRLATVGSG